jgi:hypothetical protein
MPQNSGYYVPDLCAFLLLFSGVGGSGLGSPLRAGASSCAAALFLHRSFQPRFRWPRDMPVRGYLSYRGLRLLNLTQPFSSLSMGTLLSHTGT